ncbi:MAG: isoleucine--tRNA ligase [Bacteroidetes bacterium]|nr:isoleucine--tRNA ligase [Bacteroidota bacterium]
MKQGFTEYSGLDLSAINKQILEKWNANNTFKQSIDLRAGAPTFVFYEGPPSANGMPGIHHVMARAIKDIFCRFKTMQGFRVERKAGWDTHGLPVELGVEKSLGITKEDIGKKITVEEYNAACRKDVMKFTKEWEELTRRMGYWVDMSKPYITYDNKYIETLWYLLKELYNKDLLYKGYTIQPYSPAAGTGLSSHELNQPGCYRDVKDTTCVAQFKIKNVENTYFLAWTTTPWTLPSNTALCVGEKIDYVKIKTFNPYSLDSVNLILAKPLLSSIFGKKYFETDENANEDLFFRFGLILKENNEILKEDGRKLRIELILGKPLFLEEYDIIARLIANNKNIDKDSLKQNLKQLNISEEKFQKLIDASLHLNITTPYQILEEYKGSDLVSMEYEQLIPWVNPGAGAFKVISGDFVTTEDGTGIVHIAPTFGADDDRVAKNFGVPPLMMIDKDGNRRPMVDLTGKFFKIEDLDSDFVKNNVNVDLYKEYAGRFVKREYSETETEDLNVDLCVMLKQQGLAFKIEKHTHNYPHCWRTDKPVLYYPLDSWFIKTTAVKDEMIALNNTINWKPQSTGTGRFGKWLENLNDWNLSRSRYWGTPLPIWRTEDGSEEICIGSIAELMSEIEKSIAAGFMTENPFKNFKVGDFSEENYSTKNIDLHRPFVDEIILVSPSGKAMKREFDLIDVWFDSGAMPYAQVHYPFENKEIIDNGSVFPADFISEGVDQTRGWFFTLHAISTMIKGSVAFKNVISNGLVLDKNGNKMSKRLGNAVDPFETIEKYGSDPLRWYMITNASPWENLKYDNEGIEELKRKFFGTLYNTYSFFALYANLDNFDPKTEQVPFDERPELDRWILSLLNTLIQEVTAHYENYDPTKAGRAIQDFVMDNVSNWYVRLSRKRFWKGELNADKLSAYQTLHACLKTVSLLMSPIAPFYAEQLYADVTQTDASVHLQNFPKANTVLIDSKLETQMHLAQTISSMVLALRRKVAIKVRQPLQKIIIPIVNEEFTEDVQKIADIVKSEVNVKEIELLSDASGILVKKVKANFKALGPRYGKIMKQIAVHLGEMENATIFAFEKNGSYSFDIEGTPIEISLDDVEIISEDIPGWQVANEGNITVAIDTTITPELLHEGIAREFVNRIQNLRKESGLDVTDTIDLHIQKHDFVNEAVEKYKNYIASETLCTSVTLVEQVTAENKKTIEIEEIELEIGIQKN